MDARGGRGCRALSARELMRQPKTLPNTPRASTLAICTEGRMRIWSGRAVRCRGPRCSFGRGFLSGPNKCQATTYSLKGPPLRENNHSGRQVASTLPAVNRCRASAAWLERADSNATTDEPQSRENCISVRGEKCRRGVGWLRSCGCGCCRHPGINPAKAVREIPLGRPRRRMEE